MDQVGDPEQEEMETDDLELPSGQGLHFEQYHVLTTSRLVP